MHLSFNMLAITLISIVFFHNIFPYSSGVTVGKLSNRIYIPSPSISNVSDLFYYSNNCEECLCYAIQSLTTCAVMNCLIDTHLCLFYSSYATNYSFQWNLTSYLYYFEFPPHMITNNISTSVATSEFYIK